MAADVSDVGHAERVELAAGTPQVWPYGSVGTGVRVADVTRARDALLDTAVRREAERLALEGEEA